jgi:hypothetical protein
MSRGMKSELSLMRRFFMFGKKLVMFRRRFAMYSKKMRTKFLKKTKYVYKKNELSLWTRFKFRNKVCYV